jgi:hypothetical protein
VPIALGTVDVFTVDLEGSDTAISFNGVSHSSMNFSQQFLFVAADGRTPIMIQEMADFPEPATMGMGMAGIFAVGSTALRRKNR